MGNTAATTTATLPSPAPTAPAPAHRWRVRSVQAVLLRTAIVVVPILTSVAVSLAYRRLIPYPDGGAGVLLWWAGMLVSSGGTLVLVDREARRFLPLAALLKLSMLFPDRAPSRMAVALRAGSAKTLERQLHHVRHHGVGADAPAAAATILSLAAALNAHDRRTRGHSERVRAFTDLLGAELHLSKDDRDRLRWSALLHDVGKVMVHPEVLNKADALTAEEWEILHRHPLEGARLAAPLREWLGEWADTIEQHHERWDGHGYPHGLAGEQISYGARIVAVADAFEVMTAARSYKRPLDAAAARLELAHCAGRDFDPAVVRAFLNVSIGRLRLLLGPIAWLAQVPFVGEARRLGEVMQIPARAGVAATTAVSLGALPASSDEAAAPSPVGPRPELVASPPIVAPDLLPDAAMATPAAPVATEPEVLGTTTERAAPVAVVTTGGVPPAVTPVAKPIPTAAPAAAPPPATTAAPTPPRRPVANSDSASTTARRPVWIDVLANDEGAVAQSLKLTSEPAGGNVNKNGEGRVHYVPHGKFTGTDSFSYQVCNSAGECAVAQVMVAVEPEDG